MLAHQGHAKCRDRVSSLQIGQLPNNARRHVRNAVMGRHFTQSPLRPGPLLQPAKICRDRRWRHLVSGRTIDAPVNMSGQKMAAVRAPLISKVRS